MKFSVCLLSGVCMSHCQWTLYIIFFFFLFETVSWFLVVCILWQPFLIETAIACAVCPLDFKQPLEVIKACRNVAAPSPSCCSSLNTYIAGIQKQMLITNRQAIICATVFGSILRKGGVMTNIYDLCDVDLKDFSIQGMYPACHLCVNSTLCSIIVSDLSFSESLWAGAAYGQQGTLLLCFILFLFPSYYFISIFMLRMGSILFLLVVICHRTLHLENFHVLCAIEMLFLSLLCALCEFYWPCFNAKIKWIFGYQLAQVWLMQKFLYDIS